MQRWEYKSISVARAAANLIGWTVPDWSLWTEDDKPLSAPVSLGPKLKQLGDQGWELVSVIPISNHTATGTAGFTSQMIYFFKRPVPLGTPPIQ